MQRYILATVLFLLVVPPTAVALEFELGLGAQDFGYKEFDDESRLLDREDGFIPGLRVELRQAFNDWTVGGLLSYFGGKVDYDGHTQSGTPFKTRTDEDFLRIGVRFDRTFRAELLREFNLYNAWSYRRWDRDIQGRDNVRGLFEVYDWWEAALGVLWPYRPTARREWRLDAALVYTIAPSLEVQLAGFDDTVLDLGERIGFRFQAQHTWWRDHRTGYTLGGFVEAWDFGRSRTEPLTQNGVPVGTAFEPRSESRHWGARLSITQRF